MTTSIGFDIFARDRASQTFDKMGKRVEETGSKFDKMKGLAVAAGALAGAAIISFGKGSIGAASDLSETISKSNIIFGKNAAEIDRWAAGGAKSLGLSKAAALDAAAGFGDMFSQIGFSGDQAAKMSKSVVQMSADLGSFNNLPTAEVADMMSGAFRGEYDSLQRLVPNINAARVEQQALATTHKKSTKELTAAEKAAAVLAIVQKDGSRAAGDFARTSGGMANSQKIARAQFENLQATIGKKLLPVMVKGMELGLKTADWLGKNRKIVVPLVAALGTLAAVVWTVSKAAKAYAAVQAAVNIVMAMNPIGLVVLALFALGAALVIAYKKSETFRNVVQGAFRGAAAGISFLWNNVAKPYFRLMANLWLTVAGVIVNGAAEAFGWMPKIGPKLRAAAAQFNTFRDRVNAALSGTRSNKRIYVSAPGASRVIQQLARLKWETQHIPPSVTIGVNNKLAGMRAAGGPVSAGKAYIVGEKRAELFVPTQNGMIHPSVPDESSRQMVSVGAARSASGGGGSSQPLVVNFNLDGRMVQQVLLKVKRTNGGLELGLA